MLLLPNWHNSVWYASFLSPLVYTYLIRELNADTYVAGHNFLLDLLADVTPREMPWVSLYWVFSALLLIMLIAVGISRFPKITPTGRGKKRYHQFLFRVIQTEVCMVVLPGHLLLCKYRAGNFHLHEYLP